MPFSFDNLWINLLKFRHNHLVLNLLKFESNHLVLNLLKFESNHLVLSLIKFGHPKKPKQNKQNWEIKNGIGYKITHYSHYKK